MTDSEKLAEMVRILQRIETEWLGQEPYPLRITFALHAIVILLAWIWGPLMWKLIVYIKNQREPFALLLAVALPCGVASAQDISSGWTHKYNLEAGSLTVDSQGGNSLTLFGSPSATTGKVGDGLAVDGSTQYGTTTAIAAYQGESSYSICFWVKASSIAGMNKFAVAFNKASDGSRLIAIAPYDNGGSVGCRVYHNGALVIDNDSGGPTPDGDWHFVTWVQSGSTGTLYWDGSSYASVGSLAAVQSDIDSFAIGGRPSNATQRFSGSLDQVWLNTRALTSTEVELLYEAASAPVNTVAPVMSGTLEEGETLAVTTGTWTGSPTLVYQWFSNSVSSTSGGTPISGATSNSYTLTSAEVGKFVYVSVTATNAGGSVGAFSNVAANAIEPMAGGGGGIGDCNVCGELAIAKVEIFYGGSWHLIDDGWSVYGAGGGLLGGSLGISGGPWATCDEVFVQLGAGDAEAGPWDPPARITVTREGGVSTGVFEDAMVGLALKRYYIGGVGSPDDLDGDCTDDKDDCDDDNDGTPDKDEDNDEDGIPNDEDDDDDDDGCKDNEECEDDDEDGIPNCADPDDDNDGQADHIDCDWHGKVGGCADDPVDDDDNDDDGVPNPDDPDDDNDGIPDWADNDKDNDGIPDDEDDDDDGDGVPDAEDDDDGDNAMPDSDGDGIPDPIDPDDDNDGIPDDDDPDDDNDGISDGEDDDHHDGAVECGGGGGIICCPGGSDCGGLPACGDLGGCDDGCVGDQDCDGIDDDEDDDDDGDGTPDDEECDGDQDCDGIPDEEDPDDDNDGTPDDDEDDGGGSGCACCDELLEALGGNVGDLEVTADPIGVTLPHDKIRQYTGNELTSEQEVADVLDDHSTEVQNTFADIVARASGESDARRPFSSATPLLPVAEALSWPIPEVGATLTDWEICLPFWLHFNTTIQTEFCLHTLPLENLSTSPHLTTLMEVLELVRVWLRRFVLIVVVLKAWRHFGVLFRDFFGA